MESVADRTYDWLKVRIGNSQSAGIRAFAQPGQLLRPSTARGHGYQKAPATRISRGVFPVQRLNACVNALPL